MSIQWTADRIRPKVRHLLPADVSPLMLDQCMREYFALDKTLPPVLLGDYDSFSQEEKDLFWFGHYEALRTFPKWVWYYYRLKTYTTADKSLERHNYLCKLNYNKWRWYSRAERRMEQMAIELESWPDSSDPLLYRRSRREHFEFEIRIYFEMYCHNIREFDGDWIDQYKLRFTEECRYFKRRKLLMQLAALLTNQAQIKEQL